MLLESCQICEEQGTVIKFEVLARRFGLYL